MEMKHCKFAICAIASPLEADYLDEWTKWHKSIGVQAFYIATNGWTWDNKQEDVYTTRVDGRNKQCPYYTNFAHTMASYVDWAAFIDIDEFIRLGDKHKTVLDLAEEFKLCDSVALSWRLFGSNGLHFNGNYSVLKRFTRRQTGFNKHIKSIVNLGKLKTFGDHRRLVFGTPHFPQLQARYTLQQWTVDGRQVSGPYD